jgi:hypothetical protein
MPERVKVDWNVTKTLVLDLIGDLLSFPSISFAESRNNSPLARFVPEKAGPGRFLIFRGAGTRRDNPQIIKITVIVTIISAPDFFQHFLQPPFATVFLSSVSITCFPRVETNRLFLHTFACRGLSEIRFSQTNKPNFIPPGWGNTSPTSSTTFTRVWDWEPILRSLKRCSGHVSRRLRLSLHVIHYVEVLNWEQFFYSWIKLLCLSVFCGCISVGLSNTEQAENHVTLLLWLSEPNVGQTSLIKQWI